MSFSPNLHPSLVQLGRRHMPISPNAIICRGHGRLRRPGEDSPLSTGNVSRPGWTEIIILLLRSLWTRLENGRWPVDRAPRPRCWSRTRSGWRSDAGAQSEAIAHSDRGVHFASWLFSEKAHDAGLAPSMGSVGTPSDGRWSTRSGPARRSSCSTGSDGRPAPSSRPRCTTTSISRHNTRTRHSP
jgi:hypothetical protein